MTNSWLHAKTITRREQLAVLDWLDITKRKDLQIVFGNLIVLFDYTDIVPAKKTPHTLADELKAQTKTDTRKVEIDPRCADTK